MTDAWALASQHILKVEGGWVNNPKDPGGATNWGISLRFLRDNDSDHNIHGMADVDHDGDVDIEDVKHLPVANALMIYKYAFWNPNGYASYPANTAVKLFDMAVNMGAKQGNKLFQRALNTFPTGLNALGEDGVLGAGTQGVFTKALQMYGEAKILAAIRQAQKNFYDSLIRNKPSLAVFRKGWFARADSI